MADAIVLGPGAKDLTGQTFGRLTAVKPVSRDRYSRIIWECECSCGRRHTVGATHLNTGDIQSCGCLRTEKSMARAVTHGMSYSSEYRSYSAAKSRCNNPKNIRWESYGGRGIEFRFACFAEFYAELGDRPTPQHSVDRIDNDGHYEPGNVRWATAKEQRSNQRKRKIA